MKSGFIKKADIVLAAMLLVLGLGSMLVLRKSAGAAARVYITQDGALVYDAPLGRDNTLVIDFEGESNTVVIQDSQVWVAEADCKGLDCVGFGKISREGQLIMCLPHKLLISIRGGGEIDAVLY